MAMLSRFLAEIEYVFTRTLESTTVKWKWFSNEHVSSQNVKLSLNQSLLLLGAILLPRYFA